MDTLAAILGNEPGTVARTYDPAWDRWTTVEQHKHDVYNELYWVHYDSFDNVRLYDYKFENLAFFYDVNKPIWMRA